MSKKKISNIFICLGIILVAISSYLFYQNVQIEETAQTSSDYAVDKFYEEIENQEEINTESLSTDIFIVEDETEVLIDDTLYKAVLTIQSLGLELPIQSSWSYEKLSLSPCIYQSEPLSIAGHNYTAHFGKLKNLSIGDTATLTYVSGEIVEYQVVSVTLIHETDTEELENSDYDLSLFTCNYTNNNERVLVRLNECK